MKDSIIACLKGTKAWRRCYVNLVLGNAFFLGFCLLFDISSTRSLVASLALTIRPTDDGSREHTSGTLTSCLTVLCVFASMAYVSQNKIKKKEIQILDQELLTPIPNSSRHKTLPVDVYGEFAMYEKNNHAVTDDRFRTREKFNDDLCLFLSRDQEMHDNSKVHEIKRTEQIQNDSRNVLNTETEPSQQTNNMINDSTLGEETEADHREVSNVDIKMQTLTVPLQEALTIATLEQSSQTDQVEQTPAVPEDSPEPTPTKEATATMTDEISMEDEETETEEETEIEFIDASCITSGPFMKKLRRAQRTLQEVKVNTARERNVKVKPWRDVLGRYHDKMSGLKTLLVRKDQLAGVTSSARRVSEEEVKALQVALMSSKDKLENQLKINRKLEADIKEKSCASVVAPDN